MVWCAAWVVLVVLVVHSRELLLLLVFPELLLHLHLQQLLLLEAGVLRGLCLHLRFNLIERELVHARDLLLPELLLPELLLHPQKIVVSALLQWHLIRAPVIVVVVVVEAATSTHPRIFGLLELNLEALPANL